MQGIPEVSLVALWHFHHIVLSLELCPWMDSRNIAYFHLFALYRDLSVPKLVKFSCGNGPQFLLNRFEFTLI
jgi:hypothetical protein